MIWFSTHQLHLWAAFTPSICQLSGLVLANRCWLPLVGTPQFESVGRVFSHRATFATSWPSNIPYSLINWKWSKHIFVISVWWQTVGRNLGRRLIRPLSPTNSCVRLIITTNVVASDEHDRVCLLVDRKQLRPSTQADHFWPRLSFDIVLGATIWQDRGTTMTGKGNPSRVLLLSVVLPESHLPYFDFANRN